MIMHLERYFIFSFSVLLLLGLVIPTFGQAEKKEDLIGHGKLATTWGRLKLSK